MSGPPVPPPRRVAAPAAKPLDAGTGRVCASFDAASGAWLSVGAPHPIHGWIELSGADAFDEALRGDADATRAHRLLLTEPASAFLVVELDGHPPRLEPNLEADTPRWRGPGVSVTVEAVPDARAIRQRWSVDPSRGDAITLRVRGRIDRPALAEITESDPLPPIATHTSFRVAGGAVRIADPTLPARVALRISGAATAWQHAEDGLRTAVAPRGHGTTFVVEVEVDGAPDGRPSAPGPTSQPADRLERRALAYVRGCTAMSVADDERAVITDHRLLPLSWTRDAYWQMLALLAADGRGDRQRVADHLRWLWRRCERPDGRWVRSHHTNGRRKDMPWQADQQLYPILELADYHRLVGTLPEGVRWVAELPRAWATVGAATDPELGLLATQENAADDPAVHPFISATQVLMWYAAHRLAELVETERMPTDADALRARGDHARRSLLAAAATDAPWPYAIDTTANRVEYHDANDLPVALAPLWGFCDATDPSWNATMRFALGPENPGWVSGPRAGLGSRHTSGAWTLGDVQAWIVARAIGDGPGQDHALHRLHEVAFADGMLPEAYSTDPRHDRRIRHWFAWPGAAITALRILDRSGALEARLATRTIH